MCEGGLPCSHGICDSIVINFVSQLSTLGQSTACALLSTILLPFLSEKLLHGLRTPFYSSFTVPEQ
jgi:hypothetical protein